MILCAFTSYKDTFGAPLVQPVENAISSCKFLWHYPIAVLISCIHRYNSFVRDFWCLCPLCKTSSGFWQVPFCPNCSITLPCNIMYCMITEVLVHNCLLKYWKLNLLEEALVKNMNRFDVGNEPIKSLEQNGCCTYECNKFEVKMCIMLKKLTRSECFVQNHCLCWTLFYEIIIRLKFVVLCIINDMHLHLTLLYWRLSLQYHFIGLLIASQSHLLAVITSKLIFIIQIVWNKL